MSGGTSQERGGTRAAHLRPMLPLVGTRVVAETHLGHATGWINTALRTRTSAIPDALARALTADAMDAADLRAHLLRGGAPLLPLASARVAAALATIWATRGFDPQDARAGQLLLAVVVAEAPASLTPKQRQIYAQLSFVLGDYSTAASALAAFPDIPAEVADSLRTDLLNPTVTTNDRREEWLAGLAAPFRAAGLAPVRAALDRETLFDGLHGHPPRAEGGPLVTVIMPCYRPDAGLLTSVGSMVAQTHRNLEILLVDDASGPDYHSLFAQAAALDDRVRVLRLSQNGGTYRARNAALDIARGTYITVQDADDWSHPERITEQVRVLERHPGVAGSRSDAIRATDDLTHQWVGYSPRRPNASSLMFRRDVVDTIGPFDLVRNSADSEYYERLTRVVGPVVDTSTPLAVTRLRAGSLSRADFSYHWMAPDRLLYRAAYRSWHRTLTGAPVRPTTPSGGRVFPAPTSMLRDLPGHRAPSEVDVMVVLDASDGFAVDIALGLPSAAGSVGVLHLEDATRGTAARPEPIDELLRAEREGRLHMLSPSEEVRARIGVVLSSGALESVPQPPPRTQVVDLLAVVRRATGLRDVQDHLALRDTCQTVFGRSPRWVVASAEDREDWPRGGRGLPVLSDVLKGHRSRA